MPYDPRIHHRRSIRLYGYDYSRSGLYCVTIVVRGHEIIFGEVVDGEMQVNEVGRIVEVAWAVLPVHFPSVDTDAFVLMPNHVHAIVVIGEPEEVGAGFPRPASDARPGADVGPIGEGHAVGAGSPRPVPAGSPGPASDAGRHGDAGLDGGAFAEANGGATAEVGGGETPPLRAVGVFVGKPTLGQIVGYFKQQSTKHINALWGSPGEPMWQRNYYERIVRDAAELKRLRWYIEENPERWEEDRENPACRSAKAGR